jgi:hypothetical protein
MRTVNIHEAKTRLSRFVELAARRTVRRSLSLEGKRHGPGSSREPPRDRAALALGH